MPLNNPITEFNDYLKDRRDDWQKKKENGAYFLGDLKDETVDLGRKAGRLLGRTSNSQPASSNVSDLQMHDQAILTILQAYYPGKGGGSTYGTQVSRVKSSVAMFNLSATNLAERRSQRRKLLW